MSEHVTCERCGKLGNRRRGFVAPEGWHFGSFTLDSEGDHAPGDLLIVHACSAECRDALWTHMAGHRWDAIERRVVVPDELRRAGRVHAERLRASARSILESVYPTGEDSNEPAGKIFARLLTEAAQEIERAVEVEIEWLANKSGNAGAGGA